MLFSDVLIELQPLSLTGVLKTLRNIAMSVSHEKLMLRDHSMSHPTLEKPTIDSFILESSSCQTTASVYIPSPSMHQIYVCRSYFKEHVHSWVVLIKEFVR